MTGLIMRNNVAMEDFKNPCSDMPDLLEDKIDSTLLSNSIHYLTGDITESNIGRAIKWLLYEMCIGEDEKRKHLTLYINSTGGDLDSAFALIDIINQVKNFHTVQTIGLGSVCSAAFLILTTGSNGYRHAFKNTSMMCHQYTAGFEGKHHDIKSRFKEVELSNARMINVLKENTGLDTRTIKSKLLNATDVWLTAEELVELGVADDYI